MIFLDVRKCIKTDANYRDANVDWDATQKKIQKKVATNGISITQGFLGSETTNNFTTTLGREGSDYTAAIFAYCLNAESVTIWKDVAGVLNADPRYFTQTILLNYISYRVAWTDFYARQNKPKRYSLETKGNPRRSIVFKY